MNFFKLDTNKHIITIGVLSSQRALNESNNIKSTTVKSIFQYEAKTIIVFQRPNIELCEAVQCSLWLMIKFWVFFVHVLRSDGRVWIAVTTIVWNHHWTAYSGWESDLADLKYYWLLKSDLIWYDFCTVFVMKSSQKNMRQWQSVPWNFIVVIGIELIHESGIKFLWWFLCQFLIILNQS